MRLQPLLRPLLSATLLLTAAPLAAAPDFKALLEREWDYRMQEDPVEASLLGDRRFNDRWSDQSLTAIARHYAHQRALLAELETIDRAALPAADRLDYDLFVQEVRTDIEGERFRLYLMPVSQMGGIQSLDRLVELLRFQTLKDYEDWIKRLESFPQYMDQTIALMREGIRTRRLLPKVVMERLPGQIEKQLVSAPEKSRFFAPFERFPEGIGESDRLRLRAAARKALSERVIPAYRQFGTFFSSEYLPASFPRVGIDQIPDGRAAYTYLVRRNTTTDRTPEEIHKLGLAEVKRIRAEMQRIIDQVGFKGSFAEFLAFLRTDPRFYYTTPEDLLTGYQAISKRIDPNLVKVFKTLPRTPYGVTPIPAAIAPDTTTAYYNSPAADGSRPGLYYVNLYKPETRPKYEMMALSLHEAVPGHHLQIARSQELGDLPKFRRYGGITAFIEGWGLYAESLGDDMGLYDDPYAKFGQLTYEMWRAVRLVVDTGMHSLGWSRERAIDFFLENAAKQKLDVVNEIDRYIVDPGQASPTRSAN
jgi:uncharacterized protein (DUF885 family)